MPTEILEPTQVRRLASATTALPIDVTPPGPKADILNVALRLFAERGYAGASIRDIATAAGLKPASLYAHYTGKEQMLAQLINIGHEEHCQTVLEQVAHSDPDPAQQLRAYVRGHVNFHAHFPMLALLVNHELHALSAKLVGNALRLRQQATELLTGIVRRGQAEGRFDQAYDPWLACAAIGAMGMRVAHWYTEHHEKSVEEIIWTYQLFALRLVGAAPEEARELLNEKL